jgi:hypothetical protein
LDEIQAGGLGKSKANPDIGIFRVSNSNSGIDILAEEDGIPSSSQLGEL